MRKMFIALVAARDDRRCGGRNPGVRPTPVARRLRSPLEFSADLAAGAIIAGAAAPYYYAPPPPPPITLRHRPITLRLPLGEAALLGWLLLACAPRSGLLIKR